MSKHDAPFAVIYTDETTGQQVVERHYDPQSVNDRLNELWGSWGIGGPERHIEARGVLGNRIAGFSHWRRERS